MDGRVQSIQVMPGRNRSTLPFGSVISSNLRTVNAWANDGNHEYDYGAIILSTDLGAQTGWFGIGAYTDATLNGSTVNISGYPGDKPGGTQWYHSDAVSSVGPRKVFYVVDSAGGAERKRRLPRRQRRAVRRRGARLRGSTSNSGTRITQECSTTSTPGATDPSRPVADGSLEEALLISGVVVAADGRPVAGARVALVAAPVEVPDIAALTGEDGAFSLGVPVTGSYRVAAYGDEGRAQETVDVDGGRTAQVRRVLRP